MTREAAVCPIGRWGDFSLGAMVADLEAVTRGLQGPFALIGMSQVAAVAIEFARRRPDRVSRLILVGGYRRGWVSKTTFSTP